MTSSAFFMASGEILLPMHRSKHRRIVDTDSPAVKTVSPLRTLREIELL